ncbi:MAG: kinase/pyrophosphorylase [Hyphomonadaceae bacterium]|nr:kinase/pyrophosphorylase [Hyphomonadaceae bacterium]
MSAVSIDTVRPGVYLNVHLVSDSTGETLASVLRAACAQFDNILPIEHTYYLVRTARQLERVHRDISDAPGLVMFTLSNVEQRERLEKFCKEQGHPCIPVLDSTLDVMSRYLGLQTNHRVGSRILSAEYFRRVDALNFAMGHDDGQHTMELKDADVILVGVSRTSKTPTSVYLANRGVKAANVPIVLTSPLPDFLFQPDAPLIVALTISADRLVHVRRNRLAAMKETRETSYVEQDSVRAEISHAQRMFEKYGWPVIDVTRRSVEETAAIILNHLAEKRAREE